MRTQKLYSELRSVTRMNTELASRAAERHSFANLIGKSSSMRDIYALIEKVADSHVPILITGESGTGKELVASAVHYNSSRKGRAFVVQNCSAFNENLLESELFGHLKGSFSGAIRDKQGLFEVADGGTFFLDELGEMSVALQAKLLRVLQDGTFMPVGATKQRKVDVRVVAATNRNLQEMVSKGTFREDLFYRLNVVNIRIPPLRERKVDIPLLIEHFLRKHGAGSQKSVEQETLRILSDFDWPGNIRQLENEIERLILMAGKGELITPDLISPAILSHGKENARGRRVEGKLKDAVENLERNMILDTLEKLDWNKSEAAKVLGISRSNLIAKVQAYGLEK
jgi:transcriptional regulator with PAS, ATPase and Fis domain